MTIYRLQEMFPNELEERLAAVPMLVIPFGTVEWHSHHLPLGLDGLVAERIGEAIADEADAVLAPVSYWAVGGVPYPYTLKLSIDLIEPLLIALFEQFGEMGFRVIVGFTGHFGLEQTLALKRAAEVVMQRSPLTILPATEYDMTTDAGYKGDHAGIGESSLMWAMRPDLVRMDAIPRGEPLDGVIGADPRGEASEAYGNELFQMVASRTAQVARRLLTQSSALDRAKYIDALKAGVRVLEQTAERRQHFSKSDVPSIGTPAYLAYCQAMYAGDYVAARNYAEKKLGDLRE